MLDFWNIDGQKKPFYQWEHPLVTPTKVSQREIDELRALNLAPHGVILDIGAFTGDTTVTFAIAYPESKVVAYEPNPHSFKVLEKNHELYDNIYIFNAAVSDKEELVEFNYSDPGFCNGGELDKITPHHQHNYKLEVHKIDIRNKGFKNVTLVKIDVEGSEIDVLRGLENVISRDGPIIALEFFGLLSQEARKQQLRWLNRYGYNVFLRKHDSWKSGRMIFPEDLSDLGHFDAICFRDNV